MERTDIRGNNSNTDPVHRENRTGLSAENETIYFHAGKIICKRMPA